MGYNYFALGICFWSKRHYVGQNGFKLFLFYSFHYKHESMHNGIVDSGFACSQAASMLLHLALQMLFWLVASRATKEKHKLPKQLLYNSLVIACTISQVYLCLALTIASRKLFVRKSFQHKSIRQRIVACKSKSKALLLLEQKYGCLVHQSMSTCFTCLQESQRIELYHCAEAATQLEHVSLFCAHKKFSSYPHLLFYIRCDH